MALIGLGFRQLSMSPASIGPVKAMILAVDAGEVGALVDRELRGSSTRDSLRPALLAYAESRGIAA
jgi:phosphotransferase system enzyme I (PtsP)